MNQADRPLEHQQRAAAENVAVSAGCLRRCEVHAEILINHFADETRAYKRAYARFSEGDAVIGALFASRRELTDAIQAALEHAYVSCPYCESRPQAEASMAP
jgi:hypothetical protein